MSNLVRVVRARTTPNGTDHHNWLVLDYRPPKVFVRQFTFSYFIAAFHEADRLARTGLVNPRALFGVERIEYDTTEDVAPMNLAKFFTEADQARRNVALWARLGWWHPQPQTEAEAAQIIDDYERESRER